MDSFTSNSSDPTSIEVTLTSIDGGYIVLESPEDKTKFLWPLEKIPRPLEIGSRLTLALRKDSLSGSSISSLSETTSKDDQRRKLLEELVN